MSIDDKAHSGRPSKAQMEENVERTSEIVLDDRRQTIGEVEELSDLADRTVAVRKLFSLPW